MQTNCRQIAVHDCSAAQSNAAESHCECNVAFCTDIPAALPGEDLAAAAATCTMMLWGSTCMPTVPPGNYPWQQATLPRADRLFQPGQDAQLPAAGHHATSLLLLPALPMPAQCSKAGQGDLRLYLCSGFRGVCEEEEEELYVLASCDRSAHASRYFKLSLQSAATTNLTR